MANDKKAKKEKKEKAPKPDKIAYVQCEAARALLDENGRLTDSPVDFNSKLHKSPKKTDFAFEHVYMRYRADQLEETANDYVNRATSLRSQADIMEKQPDPAMRNQVKRMARLREQLAKLEADLAAEGISV